MTNGNRLMREFLLITMQWRKYKAQVSPGNSNGRFGPDFKMIE